MNEQIKDQIAKLEQEEYYNKLKLRGVNSEFRQKELDKLVAGPDSTNPIQKMVIDSRNKRITMRTVAEAPAPASKPPSGAASKRPMSVAISSQRPS